MEFKFSRSSLSRTLIRSSLFNSIVIHKHFHHVHAQIFRCQMQGMSSKGQDSAKKVLVYVVKERETAQYFFVFEGQQLNIPSSITGLVQKAKSTGYFLVLVPLVAFCIRCIMGPLRNRVPGDLKHDVVNESEGHYRGSKRTRWKSALLDLSDPDALDTDSRPELRNPDELDTDARPGYDNFAEDHDQINSKDLSHTYFELERDYQKFLEECGMSKWGYWRGGSPE